MGHIVTGIRKDHVSMQKKDKGKGNVISISNRITLSGITCQEYKIGSHYEG